jgi:hypothetical protein
MSEHLRPLAGQFNARAMRDKWPVTCDEGLAFDSDQLKRVLAVWQAVRGTRPLPMRGDFTARSLLPHLPDIAFVERLVEAGGKHRYRFRLVGTGLASRSGDTTGKFLEEVIPDPAIESWYLAFDTALALRTPLRFVSQFRSLNLEYKTGESLVAPLCDATGAPAGLLTCVTYTPRVV